MPTVSRPTSPHLGIYRFQISSVLSIMHRFTGLALVAGMVMIVAWLCIVAYVPGYYTSFYGFMSSRWGMLLLVGWTFSFYYHLSNGIRHLFWDIGRGFSVPQLHRSGWVVVFFAFALTAATWGMAQGMVGE